MIADGFPSVSLPPHLARYVVDQDYGAYTPRDHAVWRHILRRLTARLKDKAHPSYLDGLAAAGIGVERIPSMEEMNDRLARLGWGAAAVRGFIPPAVFTELQARGILAIAADIRDPRARRVHSRAGHRPRKRRPRAHPQGCPLRGLPQARRGGGFQGHRLPGGPLGLRGHPQPERGEGGPVLRPGGPGSGPRPAWRRPWPPGPT